MIYRTPKSLLPSCAELYRASTKRATTRKTQTGVEASTAISSDDEPGERV